MGKLEDAYSAYKKLIQSQYIISAGKSRKSKIIVISFSVDEFKHIAGLHKLKDLPRVSKSASSAICQRIEKGLLTDSIIQKSQYYTSIIDRLDCITLLEKGIENSNEIYIWNKIKSLFSNIDADVLIPISSNQVYCFFESCGNASEVLNLKNYVTSQNELNNAVLEKITSIFSNSKDYTKGQERAYTVLSIEKVDLSNRTSRFVYTHPKYQIWENQRNNSTVNNIQTSQITLSPSGAAVLQTPSAAMPSLPKPPSFEKIIKAVKGFFDIIRTAIGSSSEKMKPSSKESLPKIKATSSNRRPSIAARKSSPSSAQKQEERSDQPKEPEQQPAYMSMSALKAITPPEQTSDDRQQVHNKKKDVSL